MAIKPGSAGRSNLPVVPYTLPQRLKSALLRDESPRGDLTSLATIEKEQRARYELLVKQAEGGVLSGLEIAHQVFAFADSEIQFQPIFTDGMQINKGDILALVDGPTRKILTAERTAVDIVQVMSAVATNTNKFVKAVEGTGATILDTRKFFPDWGEEIKAAVRHGGGQNHRPNLGQGLIKNNHIDFLGGDIGLAIRKFKQQFPNTFLEVEVRDENELFIALGYDLDRILLDNMTTGQMHRAVHLRNESALKTGFNTPLEASGNVTLENVRKIAQTGVEYISVGSKMTLFPESFDISLHKSKS